MQRAKLLLITLAHFCVDSYATILPPVLPLLRRNLGLSLSQSGFLSTIIAICNISQPLLGIWADRMKRRHLVIAGLILSSVFAPIIGLAPNYVTLIFILALAGFGVALFHPQVFSLAGELSGDKKAIGIALFVFGGTMGVGLTPLWVPFLIENHGLGALPLACIPGLLFLALTLKFIPLDNPRMKEGKSDANWGELREKSGPLTLITLVVITRSVSGLSFMTFLPLLAQERGLGLVDGGVPLGIYNVSGVTGALIAGYLAEKYNAKWLVVLSLILAVPPLYMYVGTENVMGGYALLAVGGGLLLASNSVLVTMAQEQAPKNSGLASSLPLGFSWGLASLSLPLVGHLADQIGVGQTLKYMALLPVLTTVFAIFLPDRKVSALEKSSSTD